VSQNMTQRGIDMTAEELADIAEAVSVGAIIYYDLKQTPGRKIVFNWEEALSFTGNTGPYLQYTNARLNTLIEKYATLYPDEANEEVDLAVLEQDKANRDLVMLLGVFPEAISLASEKLNPTIVAELLYRIAHSYNGYYTQNRVINEPNKDMRKARIVLAEAVRQTLRNGLTALNIPMPPRM
jgi:arginyl-tRNA synthetase